MKVKDIYSFLDKICPFDTALDFDNSGLLIGDENAEVQKAIVTLDCTEDTVKKAVQTGAQLIITHHPVIFDGLKKIESGKMISSLIKNDISVISAHTNLDAAPGGVNDCLFTALNLKNKKVLTAENGYPYLCGELENALSGTEFAKYLKEKLNFPPRFADAAESIKTVGVCCGAGSDCFEDAVDAGCDAFVTSEVKHHIFLKAYSLGVSIFDCGHYATEDVVVEPLADTLKNEFKTVQFITEHSSIIRSL